MLNLRNGMKIVLSPESRRTEVLAAISHWAAAAFVVCLVVATLDRDTMPRAAVLAAAINALVVTTAMGLLRSLALWRHRTSKTRL